MRWVAACGFVSIALCAAGCADEGADLEEGLDLEEEACEHLVEGPFASITALAARADSLPSAALEHTAVRIGLVQVDGGNGGFVAFEAEADGDYVFFLDANVPARFIDGAGGNVPVELAVTGSDVCAEIAVTYTVELQVGTYAVQLGPTFETSVHMVHEAETGAHAHR